MGIWAQLEKLVNCHLPALAMLSNIIMLCNHRRSQGVHVHPQGGEKILGVIFRENL